jgi:hypothetical protein
LSLAIHSSAAILTGTQRRGEALRVNISAGEGLQQVCDNSYEFRDYAKTLLRCSLPIWDPVVH